MAHKVIDRCKENTSTTGTGTLTLTGAVSGYVAMADATAGLTANGDTSWFCAENGSEWEVFLGTRVDSTHLARTTVISSSNAGAAVSFTAPPIVFGTVPAAKLSAVGPSLGASLTSAQTFTSGVSTKVAFNTEQFDNGSCYDNATTYRFTPNVAGHYQVSWLVTFKSTGALSASTYISQIVKNGAVYANSNYANCAATVAALGGSALVYMNGSTDYLEVFGVATGTGTLTFGAGTGETTFSAFLAALPGAPLLAPKPVGPAFSAYRATSTQAITTSTSTKVAFNATDFDTAACFDPTTNNRFTPNVAGYYRFEWLINIAAASVTSAVAFLRKNGTDVASGTSVPTATTTQIQTGGSKLVYMNGSSDYVELFVYAIGTSLTVAAGIDKAFLTGSFVRGT